MRQTKQEKARKLVITFPTTTAAMSMDAACGTELGRLISIPKELNGGCGLAWCAQPEQESILLQQMAENGIPYQEKQIIELDM